VQDSAAQEASPGNVNPRFEMVAAVGLGHPFRVEDQGYGNGVNFGVGFDLLVWKRLRAGAEANRTFGLSPSPVPCGGISYGPGLPALPCVGSARSGVISLTAASLTASYSWNQGRVQPYVLGGMNIQRPTLVSSIPRVRPDRVELEERISSDTGIGLTVGMGLRTALTDHLSIRPEIRFSDGTALSAANLSLLRLSVGVGYGW
jgi:opacity protein-like surface antigen